MITAIRIFTIAYALFQAYAYRFQLYQDDGLQYLDIANLALSGRPEQLINSIWSPLYPLLEAICLFVFQPEPVHELAIVRGLNFVLFLAMMASFEYFLKRLCKYRQSLKDSDTSSETTVSLSDYQLKLGSYILFATTGFCFGGVYQDTPDQLVHTFSYLSLAILINIKLDKTTTFKNHGLLGLCCGIGFMAKHIFLPYSAIFLTIGALFAKENRIKKTLIAVSFFLAFYLPFVLAVSNKLGRFTLSEAGKMSYIQVVTSDYNDHYPQGKELVHPVRKIYSKPDTYEFKDSLFSTYPAFLERSYWLEGYKIRIDLERSYLVLMVNLLYYCLDFFDAIFISLITATLFGLTFPLSIKSMRPYWFLSAFGFSILFAYSIVTNLVWLYPRYYQGVVLVLGMTYLASIAIKKDKKYNRAIKALIIAFTMPFLIRMGWQTRVDFNALNILKKPVDWLIVKDLNDIGIHKGDLVAQLGYYPRGEILKENGYQLVVTTGYYWARLAGLQIVADIHTTEQFNALDDERKMELIDKLKALGVKAIVLYRDQKVKDSDKVKWQRLQRSGRFVYLIKDDSEVLDRKESVKNPYDKRAKPSLNQ